MQLQFKWFLQWCISHSHCTTAIKQLLRTSHSNRYIILLEWYWNDPATLVSKQCAITWILQTWENQMLIQPQEMIALMKKVNSVQRIDEWWMQADQEQVKQNKKNHASTVRLTVLAPIPAQAVIEKATLFNQLGCSSSGCHWLQAWRFWISDCCFNETNKKVTHSSFDVVPQISSFALLEAGFTGNFLTKLVGRCYTILCNLHNQMSRSAVKTCFSAQTFASPTRSQGRLLQFCVNLVAKQNWCLQS